MGINERISEKDWVPVTDPMFLKEAEVIEGILGEEGIPAKIAEANSNSGRYSGFAPQLKTGQVLVLKREKGSGLDLIHLRREDDEMRRDLTPICADMSWVGAAPLSFSEHRESHPLKL